MQIYIHIPFCEQKCGYCRFASTGKIQKLHIAKYVDFLCKEINTVQSHRSVPTEKNVGVNLCVHPKKSRHLQGMPLQVISTIYFGGGTPGVLTLGQLEKIFTALKNKFTFSDNIEITLESTPDKITIQNLSGWNKLGINRLSMGVQTLNIKSLEAIGRRNKGDIERALEIIGQTHRSAPTENNVGVNLCVHPLNISLDFIIGLPHVAKGEIKKDIEYVLNKYNFVKHVSVYMLEDYYNADKVKPHSVSPKRREEAIVGLDKEDNSKFQHITYPEDWGKMGIGEEDYLGEYSEIKQYLESKGFSRYEISNYAKNSSSSGKGEVPEGGWGYQCKHNQGYWNHSEVLGFGLGAYGFVNNTRYANSEKFSEYYEGKRILETKLSQEDLFLETVMFQLRTTGLSEENYKKLNQEKIKYFIEEGYLTLLTEGFNSLKLTDKGVLVMDYILGEIV